MSLWNKPINEIQLRDVEEFCAAQIPEGSRLDYKGDMPNDFAKLVASFANTQGGLILLGAAADKTTNKPLLPIEGMPITPGIGERIIQICRDNIYPPILPQISSPIEKSSGKGFVVVRVDESPEAPHAINNQTRIYIRTGEVSHPIELANLSRIEYLLERRRNAEASRERCIELSQSRAINHLQPIRQTYPPAMIWVSVIPVFAWRSLCTREHCLVVHRRWPWNVATVQRAPDGTIGYARGRPYLDSFEEQSEVAIGFSCIGANGHVFVAERIPQMKKAHQYHFGLKQVCQLVRTATACAQDFYGDASVEIPGLLQLAISFLGVRSVRMQSDIFKPEPLEAHRGGEFPDDGFRTQTTFTAHELLDTVFAHDRVNELERPLLDDVAFAFDLTDRRW